MMKNISLITTLMIIMGIAMTGCKDDTQPRLNTPSEFVLNTPALANQLYIITESSHIDFTMSQPNYGVGCVPNYQIYVSDTQDFANAVEVDYVTTDAAMSVPGEKFSTAICTLFGYDDPENFDSKPRPVYVRAKAWMENAPYSEILSNVVCLAQVSPYFAVKLPDAIYLVGQPNGWNTNTSMPIYETEIGNRIYQGVIDVNANEFQFRFYDEFNPDAPWDWNSIGSQDGDSPKTIAFTDGIYDGPCFYDPNTKNAGKGSWEVPDFPGGKVKITVNLAKKTVVFELM
ncbi:MAG: SusE domain-containing protein [Muribaculaceae bacterium]|nr:SusE domain-containing protein [Muribaculaceae bacterium]